GPHNRMVGNNPGQFTTGVYTDGPDAGRVWWRRNSEPGAPPNPKRHNQRPDVAALFLRNLEQARAHIHPPPQTPAPPQRRNTYELTEMIPPPISAIEARLALLVFHHAH
ncbi:MAG: HNH endonuclease, partial [Actinomycetota bacterium]|nr:HNH endonuclease [Actinomycetota bacterium]